LSHTSGYDPNDAAHPDVRSKSLLGLVASVLATSSELDPDHKGTDLVPEVGGTVYKGATIAHLLDMRAGVAFAEGLSRDLRAIIIYRKATNWVPLDPGTRHQICARFIPP